MNDQPAKRQKRGAVQKEGATFIAAWIPDATVAALDRAVVREDTDRSKLMRKALHAYLRSEA